MIFTALNDVVSIHIGSLFYSVQSIRLKQVPVLSQALNYVLCEERNFSVFLWSLKGDGSNKKSRRQMN